MAISLVERLEAVFAEADERHGAEDRVEVEQRRARLAAALVETDRLDDLKRTAVDPEYRDQLFAE